MSASRRSPSPFLLGLSATMVLLAAVKRVREADDTLYPHLLWLKSTSAPRSMFLWRHQWYEYIMTLVAIVTRLFAAALIGCLIGFNRFAHHRYIGVRTLGLVSLGAAGLVIAALENGSGSDQIAAASRIIQGIVTGIGFLGAGVIVQRERGHKVHGLTTAATVWVAAAAGTLCGLGAWRVAATLTGLVGLVLFAGGPIERYLIVRYGSQSEEKPASHPWAEPPEVL